MFKKKTEEPIKTYELYQVVDNQFDKLVYVTDCLKDMHEYLATLTEDQTKTDKKKSKTDKKKTKK